MQSPRETDLGIKKAGPEGLEPPTYCLEGSCSIQMSYEPVNICDSTSHCEKSQQQDKNKAGALRGETGRFFAPLWG